MLTLLLLDVDRFKEYNDSYGHPQGDQVLKAVADAMHATLNRPGDLCFRIGGDEFACLFASNSETESEALAERIRDDLAARLIPHAGNPPFGHVTLSLGLAFIGPDSTLTQGEVYELGDQALYRAKHKGRNKVSR
jgi:diguanylate cyclase (GGDEF)-like protein